MKLFNKLIPELIVKNMQESLRFYVGLIGFKVEYHRADPAFYFLSKDGNQLMLEEYDATKNPWVTETLEYPFGRGINLQMEVENVESIYKRFREDHILLFKDLCEETYKTGDSSVRLKQFLVQDPDGYLLRFVEAQ